jgi:hypothetical protein
MRNRFTVSFYSYEGRRAATRVLIDPRLTAAHRATEKAVCPLAQSSDRWPRPIFFKRRVEIWIEAASMWRSFFLAVGITACILGGECLVVEKAVLAAKQDPLLDDSQGFAMPFLGGDYEPAKKEFVPPDWAPWSLISGGAIIMIYSFTIPRRLGSG